MNTPETITFKTSGTCCKQIQVSISDNKIVDSVFLGGCNGNLKGIKNLIKGRDIDELISDLQGIRCGEKNTSCPDQLAQCLMEYKKTHEKVSI